MRGFTFKSLKSLKAPGLDGFDISLLNLHRASEAVSGVGVEQARGKQKRAELQLEGVRF